MRKVRWICAASLLALLAALLVAPSAVLAGDRYSNDREIVYIKDGVRGQRGYVPHHDEGHRRHYRRHRHNDHCGHRFGHRRSYYHHYDRYDRRYDRRHDRRYDRRHERHHDDGGRARIRLDYDF